MDISRNIYVDPKLKNTKITLWKLKRDKKVKSLYCIVYMNNEFLEITHSNKLHKYLNKGTLIGISKSKVEAIQIIKQMFQDVYIPNPSISFMREYFTK